MNESKGQWRVERDEEDFYVCWGPQGKDTDECMMVYLPKKPAQREHAAQVIARALNRAKIPEP